LPGGNESSEPQPQLCLFACYNYAPKCGCFHASSYKTLSQHKKQAFAAGNLKGIAYLVPVLALPALTNCLRCVEATPDSLGKTHANANYRHDCDTSNTYNMDDKPREPNSDYDTEQPNKNP
jgi:hypothetical protein